MLEVFRPNEDPTPRANEIIKSISELGKQISSIYSLRTTFDNQSLPPKEWLEVRQLHSLRDQKIIDLLLFKNGNPTARITTQLLMNKNEKLHNFSLNALKITVPSLEKPNDTYFINAGLYDLRRDGVAQNSIDALRLIGKPLISDENDFNFVKRTKSELLIIKNAMNEFRLNDFNKRDHLESLENLSASLIQDRLMPLKSSPLLPGVNIDFLMYQNKLGDTVKESVKLKIRDREYEFIIPGQKLKHSIKEIGGYDKIITLI